MPEYSGPVNPDPKEDEASIIIYGYVPTLALGAIAVATFGLAFFAHGWYFLRLKRTRVFEGLLAFGCMMEAVGYGFRIASSKRPFVVTSFIVQYFLIVCAPVLFSAAFYLTLSLATRFDTTHRVRRVIPIPPKALLTFFVCVDAITTVVQVAGAALIGASESAQSDGREPPVTTETANNILLAGLAVQCASFLTFLVLLVLTALRNKPSVASSTPDPSATSDPEKTSPPSSRPLNVSFLTILFITSLAVFLRTTFRLAETAEGVFSFASTHESLFGTLEYTPVIVAVLVWTFVPLEKII